MALTPLDIHNKEFNVRFRGYDQDQVNDFLEQIIKDYEALLRHNEDVERALKDSQEKVAYFTDLKDALNQSIIVAQDAADKVKVNAQREAEIIQDNAEKQARQLLNESTDKSNQILQEASDKARQITGETDDLKKQTRTFRQRLQIMLESQLEIVKSPDWDELLTDTPLGNSNGAANQQLDYNTPGNYDGQSDYAEPGTAQNYNFDDHDANADQYGQYDDQNQYDTTSAPSPDAGPVPHQDPLSQGDNAQNAATNPAQASDQGQSDADHQLDPVYYNQNQAPDNQQNRPAIIFPDSKNSGTMNENKS
ncbi:cell-division initiation protein (septum placement) [Agrilactobacillus composti DSM 18527 = JCM 14202]|uniref:Cell-division initiation protein (Septum placement) n=1 Tax=Agrilactobacillus composti DSM 18527 = JCM 14202 TaxID=1423734 RepID=X0PPU3_9LACO|nr:cell-division initiation protein (septum placement) [Agrilactobacillus composti DSM 18527 = JCM 14202]GAF39021.1 cell division initiation protein DivIVA [Agrilactobacillus composti DSM 18527 = JCM 14202]